MNCMDCGNSIDSCTCDLWGGMREFFAPKPPQGEIVNPHVLPHQPERKPNFKAMRCLTKGTRRA